MDKKEIEEKLVNILKKYARRQEVWENYTPQSNILEDLKINSARFVDIMLDMEDEFDLEIEDEDMDNIATIEDAVNIIQAKLSS